MKVSLKKVRLSFPDLFVAKQYEGKGDFKYAASFLIEPGSDNDKAVQAAIKAVAVEKWGKRVDAVLESIRGSKQQYCYLKGDSKEYEGYAGMLVLSAKRKQKDGRPLVIDQAKNPLNESDGKPYAGCYVNATVDIWAQDGTHTGIRGGLLGVQFHSDGDAFSGGAVANPDDFEALDAGADAAALV
jgi:hypothetical protein